MRDVIALCWYVPLLQEGGQDRLAGSASDGWVRFTTPDDGHMVARNMLSNY